MRPEGPKASSVASVSGATLMKCALMKQWPQSAEVVRVGRGVSSDTVIETIRSAAETDVGIPAADAALLVMMMVMSAILSAVPIDGSISSKVRILK